MDKNDTWDIYIISHIFIYYMMKYRTQICVRLSLSCSELQQTPSGKIGLNTIQIFPYRCLCLYISLFSEIWEKLCFENYLWSSPRAHSGCGHTGHNPDTDWAETGRLPPPASPPRLLRPLQHLIRTSDVFATLKCSKLRVQTILSRELLKCSPLSLSNCTTCILLSEHRQISLGCLPIMCLLVPWSYFYIFLYKHIPYPCPLSLSDGADRHALDF